MEPPIEFVTEEPTNPQVLTLANLQGLREHYRVSEIRLVSEGALGDAIFARGAGAAIHSLIQAAYGVVVTDVPEEVVEPLKTPEPTATDA